MWGSIEYKVQNLSYGWTTANFGTYCGNSPQLPIHESWT